jgi:hypothetical protein
MKRKYLGIAKVYPNTWVKYRTNHPENLVNFLKQKFQGLLFVNFYEKKTERLIGNWGSKMGFRWYK